MIPTLAPYVLPRVLPELQRRHPGLRIELRETQTRNLMDELARGSLDAALLALPIEEGDFETRALFDDPFLLAVPAADRRNVRTRIDPRDIDPRRLILLEEGHCLRDQALAFCGARIEAASGNSTGLGATSLATVMQMVANGYGITLLPRVALPVEVRDERVKVLRFRNPEPARQIGLAWRRTSPRKADFVVLGQIVTETSRRSEDCARQRRMSRKHVAVIGAGPAGLMAAEVLAAGGALVTVYDHMPSAGRKFLMAGRGGLNLTHNEDMPAFLARYGTAKEKLQDAIEAFPPSKLRAWADELGAETFVGSSGRVFPKAMKASPLLRAWLRRLDAAGVRFAFRHAWKGWDDDGALKFVTPSGPLAVYADATVLALGGASWPRLGSDGAWTDTLGQIGVSNRAPQAIECRLRR